MRSLASIVSLAMVLVVSSCDQANLEKAKEIMKEDSRQNIQVAVLFDNSISYKPHIDKTLDQVKDIFRLLANDYPETNTSLVMVDHQATIIWRGLSKDLQTPYDELADLLTAKTSKFTNLSDAVGKACYLLKNSENDRKIILVFSDLKHSMPDYHPADEEIIPPPDDFPWTELRGIEIFAFYVPYRELKAWKTAGVKNGISLSGFLPEEMKTAKAAEIIFGKEE